jgi:alkylation response protein AidB-like acyl-CoA dehydrogenase
MYTAPLKDLRFVLTELVGDATLAEWPDFADYSAELRDSVLEEAAKFAATVLDPLYRVGDIDGAQWTPDGVRMPPGFKEAYRKYVESGWPALRGSAEYGGQGLPSTLVTAVEEMWASANLAFKLCPMLTLGASEAIGLAGTAEQKRLFLAKLVSGEWSGAMNLTESQAGSDLSLIRTRAVRDGDHYRLYGQKIFITYGDQDLTANVIHLVLARIDGAPDGTRGISMFIVPKYLVNDAGSLGARNDVQCLSIEHKLGIHASPTCVMAYGQKDGAVGYLIGEENRGLEYMFIMMNAARLSVGVEGYAVAERAFQQAVAWARSRLQGRPISATAATAGPQPIINHPDVKRMLLLMRSQTEAMRALALYTAFELDTARHHPDQERRRAAQARGDLFIPIVKGWSTETGIEVASIGIQVHGGMGFIEETGAAQALRDVRICTIYEGTTGIQAADLAGRKIARDGGAALTALLADMQAQLEALPADDATLKEIRRAALEGVVALGDAGQALGRLMAAGPEQGLAVSVPFLCLAGIVCGGWLLARSAAAARRLASEGGDQEFLLGKVQSARFYAAQVLPRAEQLRAIVKSGAGSVSEADAALI